MTRWLQLIKPAATIISSVTGLYVGLFEIGWLPAEKWKAPLFWLLTVTTFVTIIAEITSRIPYIKRAITKSGALTSALNTLNNQLEEIYGKRFRCNIMIPGPVKPPWWFFVFRLFMRIFLPSQQVSALNSKIKVKYFSTNMVDDEDYKLELNMDEGCAGKAFQKGELVFLATRRLTQRQINDLKLTDETVKRTKELKTIISIPFKIEIDVIVPELVKYS